MAETKYYLAIDIGASSGRHIVGWSENGEIKTDEVYRFQNYMDKTEDGHFIWDINRLSDEVKNGIKIVLKKYPEIESLAIDTWGVDYVLFRYGKPVLPCYAYRDNRTALAVKQVHGITPFEYLYSHTGIQYQPFNTIYQLYDDMTCGRLKGVTGFLMMPEYLNFMLTGKKIKEYTNATTTGIVNSETHNFDNEIISALNIPSNIFGRLYKGGTVIGNFTHEIQAEIGGNITVKLCASHDTASAFEAVDNPENSILISSGTWSLIGVKLKNVLTTEKSRNANFTNEGGVGYFRFLKNITGMWINMRLHKEFGLDYSDMQQLAKKSSFDEIIDVNDNVFTAPSKMSEEIKKWLSARSLSKPETPSDLFRCVYRSLAYAYKRTIDEIEDVTEKTYGEIYIIGGGAKNDAVNSFVAELTRKKIVALPIEATAIGNIKSQMR